MRKALKELSKWMTTPGFLFGYISLIVFWVMFNIFSPAYEKFDVSYSLLNVVMGLVATTQATTIAIAQKDQSREQKKSEKLLENRHNQDELKRSRYIAHIMESLDTLLEHDKTKK